MQKDVTCPRSSGHEAEDRPLSHTLDAYRRRHMQGKLVTICSQVAEVGLFVGAACALAAGILGLR